MQLSVFNRFINSSTIKQRILKGLFAVGLLTAYIDSYAVGSSAITPHSHSTMQHKTVVDTRPEKCINIQTPMLYAHGKINPEAPKTANAQSCPTGYVAVGADGAVAGGDTYLVVAGIEKTRAMRSTGTAFGVQCCPLISTWEKKPKKTH